MIDENHLIIDEVNIDSAVITLRSDGIMNLHFIAKDEVSLADLKECWVEYIKLGKGKKYPNLVTFEENYVPLSSEAKVFAASKEGNQYTICDAIVVKSVAMRLMINVYLKFNKPVIPTSAFSSEEKAIAWLKTFL